MKEIIRKLAYSVYMSLSYSGVGELPSPPDIVRDVVALYEGGIYKTGDKRFVKRELLNIPYTLDPELILSDIQDTNSMLGAFDYKHTLQLLKIGETNRQAVIDWVADAWINSKGLKAADCVYRVMVDPSDDVWDFTKPNVRNGYCVHRVFGVNYDQYGRYFTFKGINPITNPIPDKWKVRDNQIMAISMGVVY